MADYDWCQCGHVEEAHKDVDDIGLERCQVENCTCDQKASGAGYEPQ